LHPVPDPRDHSLFDGDRLVPLGSPAVEHLPTPHGRLEFGQIGHLLHNGGHAVVHSSTLPTSAVSEHQCGSPESLQPALGSALTHAGERPLFAFDVEASRPTTDAEPRVGREQRLHDEAANTMDRILAC